MDPIRAGSTFLYFRSAIEQLHLWIVLTDPDLNGNVAAVLVRSRKSYTDDTVILREGDHVFIEHESSVSYSDLDVLRCVEIRSKVLSGKCRSHEDATPELLQIVREGVFHSPYVEPSRRDYCCRNGLTPPNEPPEPSS